MELDLDKTLEGLLEWDFALTINGVRYPTHPVSVGDVARLQAAITSADASIDGLIKTVGNLFAGEAKPPVESWQASYLLGVVSGVTGYWRGVVSKNSQAIASRVAAAMAPRSTTGNSTQRS